MTSRDWLDEQMDQADLWHEAEEARRDEIEANLPTELEQQIIDIIESYFRYTLRVDLDEDIPACAKQIVAAIKEGS